MNNLEPNKIYQVSEVLEKEIDCPFSRHEEPMVLVELIEPNLNISMHNKEIFVGSITKYYPIKCEEKDCNFYEYCHPETLLIRKGQKIKVIKVVKKIKNCPLGYHLSVVEIKKRF